jgi:molybdenum cofactor synthesis domain-containing protein
LNFIDVRSKGFTKRVKLKIAIEICLKEFSSFIDEEIDLKEVSPAKRILTTDVTAKRSIPPFNRSAMDGYALVASDTAGCSENNPVTLKILGKFEIGEIPNIKVVEGTTVRVSTGGILPEGANAVIMIEDTSILPEKNDYIEIYASIHPGKNVSPSGEDFHNNTLLFEAGRRLKAVDRAFILSSGNRIIKVSSVPSIGILSTGSELSEPWNVELPLGKIPDVNSINLQELCQEEGWNAEIIGIVPDEEELLKKAIVKAVSNYDVLILSGGSSVGERDYIPLLLNNLGKLIFHGIAMRPGGPVCSAKVGKSIIFGLPGFPTASLITFYFLIRPVLLSLLGMKNYTPLTIQAKISRNVGSRLGRLDFLRVKIKKEESGGFSALPIQIGASGILSSLVHSDGLIMIPDSSEGLKEGDIVDVILLSPNVIDHYLSTSIG